MAQLAIRNICVKDHDNSATWKLKTRSGLNKWSEGETNTRTVSGQSGQWAAPRVRTDNGKREKRHKENPCRGLCAICKRMKKLSERHMPILKTGGKEIRSETNQKAKCSKTYGDPREIIKDRPLRRWQKTTPIYTIVTEGKDLQRKDSLSV